MEEPGITIPCYEFHNLPSETTLSTFAYVSTGKEQDNQQNR
jgi:hypothetical protein